MAAPPFTTVVTWVGMSSHTQCEEYRGEETLHHYHSAEWTAPKVNQEWVDAAHHTQITQASRV